jgi:hypothetical protein
MSNYNILNGIRQCNVQRKGQGISGRVWFQIETTGKIDLEKAAEIQREKGYDPRGYGGPWSFNCKLSDPVLMRYLSSWSCSTSCN